MKKLNFFGAPSQIFAVYIKSNHFLTLIIKHEPDEKDDKVIGIELSTPEDWPSTIDDRVLSDPYWKNRGVLVDLAGTLGNLSSRPIFDLEKPSFNSMGALGNAKEGEINDGYVQFFVDINSISPRKLLETPTKKNGITKKERSSKKTPKIKRKLLGAVWYPPFVFEHERISIKPYFVAKLPYKKNTVLFNNYIFIFIESPIDDPEPFLPKAIEYFNEIISVAQFFGVEGCAVTSNDLMTFEYDKDFNRQTGMSRQDESDSLSVRTLISEDFISEPSRIYQLGQRFFREYSKKIITQIVESAEKITKNQKVRDYILSFLDAKTHFLIEQYKTSFLLTWIILEKYIDDLWTEYLTSRNLSKTRFGKLARSMLWTVDDKLEALNLIGILPSEHYFEIVRLKVIRNSIVHKGRNVTKEETEECLRVTKKTLKGIIREKCFIEIPDT